MRLRRLSGLILLAFVLLIFGLAYSQIIKGGYYFRLSQNNRIKLVRLQAARGSIYDRQGRLLAGTRTSFNAALLVAQARDIEQALEKISRILEVSPESLLRQYKKNLSVPFIPVLIALDISKEQAIILESRESEIPGLVIQTELTRDYRYEQDLCHVLGYLGQINESELERYKLYGLRSTDLIGKGGLEEKLDYYLRGQAGGMQVEVNNRGYKVRVLGSRPAQAGSNLHLTLDARLQQFSSSLLEGRKGACIVLNPQNGEILALVSRPDFRPSLFLDALSGKPQVSQEITRLLNSPEAPLINRAISSTYPPGSIFKIVVAVAGLETATISPQKTFFCPGYHKIGNRDFFCWNLDGHGSENIYTALAHSCNVFFYNLGLRLGVDNLTNFSRKLGFGQATGIDLPYEADGLVPSQGWKLKVFKERWYDGETANFSIGQGYLLSSPLQVAQAVAAIANGGYLVRPHLVKRIEAETLRGFRRDLGFSQQTTQIIKEGMRQAIEEPGGTAQRAYIPGVHWAAKTGTAQTALGNPHGWFAGFYPLDNPQALVLVFLEGAGSGGEAPAAIAREIVEYIRTNKINLE